MDNSWSDVMKKLPSYCFVIVYWREVAAEDAIFILAKEAD
jgi:hypothetical protein